MLSTLTSWLADVQDSFVLLQGLLPEKKIFEVHIEKGHKHNAKVVLRGEAGYSEPGIQPGDVIFVLEQKPHKTFKRIQADLVIEKVCFLEFWLLIVNRRITHLSHSSQECKYWESRSASAFIPLFG